MCTRIPPFSVCGPHGYCSNNSFCICDDDSWAQSSEMALFIKDSSFESSLPCDTNETLLRFLYAALGVTCLLSLLLHLLVVEIRKNKSRLLPVLGFLLLLATASLLRVSDMSRLLGQDALFNTLVYLASLLLDVAAVKLIIGYFNYIVSNRYPLLERLYGPRLERCRQLHLLCYLNAVASAVEGLALPFVSFSTGKYLFLATCGHRACNQIVYAFTNWYLFGFLHKDVQDILHGVRYKADLDIDTRIGLRRVLPILKKTEISFFRANMLVLPLWLLPLFWQFGFTLQKYLTPIICFVWSALSIIIIYPQVRYSLNKDKKFAKVVEYGDLLK